MYEPTTTAVGMDISDLRSHICVIDDVGEVIERTVIRSTPRGLEKYFGNRPHMHIAIETGPHTRWMYVLLTELGHEVLVADARRLRAIYENENKDDAVDAETLARLRRVDPIAPHNTESGSSQAQERERRAFQSAREVGTRNGSCRRQRVA